MRTANYHRLLLDAAEFAGLDPETLQEADANSLRRGLSASLRMIWESNPWPDLMAVEQRGYREAWNETEAYVAGDEIYWPASDGYYQALRGSTGQAPTVEGELNAAYWAACLPAYTGGDYSATAAYAPRDVVFYDATRKSYACHTAGTGHAPTDENYFGELKAFETSVALDADGQTAIGEVFSVRDGDPRITPYGATFEFWIIADAVLVVDGPARPWLEFRRRVPELTGSAWEATAAYDPGAQVEFTDGELYDCVSAAAAGESPASEPEKWRQVEIPHEFGPYMAHSAAAIYLKRTQQFDAFRVEWELAKGELAGEVEKLVVQQKQQQRLEMAVR